MYFLNYLKKIDSDEYFSTEKGKKTLIHIKRDEYEYYKKKGYLVSSNKNMALMDSNLILIIFKISFFRINLDMPTLKLMIYIFMLIQKKYLFINILHMKIIIMIVILYLI